MTLDEAIDFISDYTGSFHKKNDPKSIKALKLLSEAGKHFTKCRKEPCWLAEFLLPGETKE